jgi:hypothetical protein
VLTLCKSKGEREVNLNYWALLWTDTSFTGKQYESYLPVRPRRVPEGVGAPATILTMRLLGTQLTLAGEIAPRNLRRIADPQEELQRVEVG